MDKESSYLGPLGTTPARAWWSSGHMFRNSIRPLLEYQGSLSMVDLRPEDSSSILSSLNSCTLIQSTVKNVIFSKVSAISDSFCLVYHVGSDLGWSDLFWFRTYPTNKSNKWSPRYKVARTLTGTKHAPIPTHWVWKTGCRPKLLTFYLTRNNSDGNCLIPGF